MKTAAVIMYMFMLVFDFALFAGTAFLITQYDWSAWWMAFALYVAACVAPGTIISILTNKTDEA